MATKITDHTVAALARRPERDKDKSNVALLITSFVDQIQELEDAFYQLFSERSIEAAVGTQLDDIGVIVDQPRNGATDDDYRRFLRARIAANDSEGRIEDLNSVARGVLNDATLSIVYTVEFPASLTMHIESGLLASGTADILISFLRDTAAGGVRILLHHWTVAETSVYTMGSVTALSGAVLLGATTLPVDSTAGFPNAGSLIIDDEGGGEEAVTYTSLDATNFYGVSALAGGHAGGIQVKTGDDSSQGFSDTGAPTTGGEYSSVLE